MRSVYLKKHLDWGAQSSLLTAFEGEIILRRRRSKIHRLSSNINIEAAEKNAGNSLAIEES